jgi:hypothetical protein
MRTLILPQIKRPLLLIAFLAMSLMPVQPAIASSPGIVGEISGVELCAQSGCDAAIFMGTCDCRINDWHTLGFFWIAVQHDPLPAPLDSSAILGGKWNLTTLWGKFSGNVVEGSIVNNGDNTFNVTATLRLQKDGTGDVIVSGVLDHTDFPPTFDGELIQP